MRRATDADRPAVLALLADSLGWERDDDVRRVLRLEARAEPVRRVAGVGRGRTATTIVGFRTFLRWEFEHPDGRARRAVRAVDTATAPAYQGRGIFRRLTTTAVDELTGRGRRLRVQHAQRPEPARLPAHGLVDGRAAAARRRASRGARRRCGACASARVPAGALAGRDRPPGVDAPTLLADDGVGRSARRARPRPPGCAPRRRAEYLRWRYGLPALGYRALAVDDDPAAGLAVFRLRRRGGAAEAGVSELLVPAAGRDGARRLLRAVAREAGADYVIRLGRAGRCSAPRLRAASPPGPDPHVPPARRPRRRRRRSRDLDLALGDVERCEHHGRSAKPRAGTRRRPTLIVGLGRVGSDGAVSSDVNLDARSAAAEARRLLQRVDLERQRADDGDVRGAGLERTAAATGRRRRART